jgi:hypothetical protein
MGATAMTANLYTFFRRIQDNSGERVDQIVSVYADHLAEAKELLEKELAKVRGELEGVPTGSRQREPSFEETPDWTVNEVVLDKPKVVAFFVT